jgi:hypothetical protein
VLKLKITSSADAPSGCRLGFRLSFGHAADRATARPSVSVADLDGTLDDQALRWLVAESAVPGSVRSATRSATMNACRPLRGIHRLVHDRYGDLYEYGSVWVVVIMMTSKRGGHSSDRFS